MRPAKSRAQEYSLKRVSFILLAPRRAFLIVGNPSEAQSQIERRGIGGIYIQEYSLNAPTKYLIHATHYLILIKCPPPFT